MTLRDRIINFLHEHPNGIDDDRLATTLGVKQRQQVNICCRQLASEGLLSRQATNGKIHNFWIGHPLAILPVTIPATDITPLLLTDPSKLWFWEGNVQVTVARYLVSQAWTMHSLANTATKAPGKDIIAERNRILLWLSVKGYPEGTEKTSHSTQAGHSFSEAIFDIIIYRGESAKAELGLALPDFPRYRSLAHKITWFQPVARFGYYWVTENGDVEVKDGSIREEGNC